MQNAKLTESYLLANQFPGNTFFTDLQKNNQLGYGSSQLITLA